MPVAVGELEDPRRMLDQAVMDMREDVSKMRQAAAQVLQPLFLTPALAACEWVDHVCPWQVLYLGSVLGVSCATAHGCKAAAGRLKTLEPVGVCRTWPVAHVISPLGRLPLHQSA